MSVQRDNPLDLIGAIGSIVQDTINDLVKWADATHKLHAIVHWLGAMEGAFAGTKKGARYLVNKPGQIETWIDDADEGLGTPFVEAFLRAGLGVNPDYDMPKDGPSPTHHPADLWGKTTQWSSDSKGGVNTLKRLIAFAIMLPFAWTAIEGVLKIFGANRVTNAISQTLGHIPEEMGISWALGMALSSLFETAAGRQLEELVNVQLHPNRLDMMTLRTLARQRHITPEHFWAGLERLGYPDDLKHLILQLDTQQLPVTDLQTAYAYGILSKGKVEEYLSMLGFSDGDRQLLSQIYIDKAETTAATAFRTMIRTAYREQRITEPQFKDMLSQLLESPQNPPTLSRQGTPHYDAAAEEIRHIVDLEAAAIRFEIQFGHAQLTVTDLKKLYLSHHMTLSEVHRALADLGYSDEDAAAVISTWQIPTTRATAGLTSAKVLQYFKGGVLTKEDAFQRLLGLGMPTDDARFLVDNPDPKMGPVAPPFTVATVTQGYQDGAVNQSEAEGALRRLGLSGPEVRAEMTLAHYKAHHALATPGQLTRLEKGDVERGYEAGGIGDAEAINLLEEMGYPTYDAGLVWAGWYHRKHGNWPGQPAVTPA